jgi:hypothetical protein
MRRLNVCAFSLMTAGLMAIAAASPAAAEDKPISVRVISMAKPTGPSRTPATAYNGLATTNVTVGVDTPGVPCGNCVDGAGTPNIGVPWPQFAYAPGTTLTISDLWEATTYTGECTAQILLKQGGAVVFSTSFAFPGGCAAGGLYGVIFTVPAPATTGFTTIIGNVHGGTNLSGADTFINVE